MRKVVIVLASLAVTGLAYWGYLRLSGSTPLEPPVSLSGHELKLPETTGDAQRFGQTVIHDAERSRYVNLDPVTKEVKRVFGFSRLLNPGSQSSRWQVEKPYIIFYESSFQCRVDADNGMFQVENAGASASPRDGQLDGNVVIHLIPNPGGSLAETHLLLDDLLFSSERTEFSTDGPVRMVSTQAELLGRGLVLLFNAQDGQVEYLHILDLESLRFKDFVGADKKAKTPAIPKEEPAVSKEVAAAATTPEKMTEPKTPAGQSEPRNTTPLYQCVIDNNVMIHYGDQIVVAGADQVDILNISRPQKEEPKPAEESQSTPSISAAVEPKNTATTATAEPDQLRESPVHPAVAEAIKSDDSRDVVVTCDGGIVFKPMSATKEAEAGVVYRGKTSVAADDTGKVQPSQLQANSAVTVGTDDAASSKQPPARFETQKINYDLLTGSGRATGPVRFVFYQPADPNSDLLTLYWPVEISADGDTEFIAGTHRQIETVIFNRNVYGVKTQQFAAYTQKDAFRCDTMAIKLGADTAGNTDIQQVTLRDGDVFAESIRTHETLKLAHTRLSCQQIQYGVKPERFVATGPGQIELDNSKAEAAASTDGHKGSINLSGPSFAQIKGFDSIEWTSVDRRIVADAETTLLELAYIPVVDGKPAKVIRAASGHVELDFSEDADGRTQLAKLTATDRVYFEEPGQHILEGYTLLYPAVEGSDWLSITGTEERPCMADGARVPYIHYNRTTGDLETRLSTIPGAVPVPPQK